MLKGLPQHHLDLLFRHFKSRSRTDDHYVGTLPTRNSNMMIILCLHGVNFSHGDSSYSIRECLHLIIKQSNIVRTEIYFFCTNTMYDSKIHLQVY